MVPSYRQPHTTEQRVSANREDFLCSSESHREVKTQPWYSRTGHPGKRHALRTSVCTAALSSACLLRLAKSQKRDSPRGREETREARRSREGFAPSCNIWHRGCSRLAPPSHRQERFSTAPQPPRFQEFRSVLSKLAIKRKRFPSQSCQEGAEAAMGDPRAVVVLGDGC